MKTNFLKAAFFVAGFLFLGAYPADAVDELVLNGVVQSIDSGAKTISVYVKSSACQGQRVFRYDDFLSVDSSLIGKNISFGIDTSRCRSDVQHKVTSLRR